MPAIPLRLGEAELDVDRVVVVLECLGKTLANGGFNLLGGELSVVVIQVLVVNVECGIVFSDGVTPASHGQILHKPLALRLTRSNT